MKIAIVSDTNSGITKEEAKELGVYLVGIPIIVGNKTFYEGVNITEDELLDALESGENITTSQPSLGNLIETWNQAFADGYDYVIYIPVSRYLSHAYETAYALSFEFEGRVFVVDNHQISLTLRNSILNARSLVEKGLSAEEIKNILEKDSENSFMYFTVDNLKYMKKSGRISGAIAAIGGFLSIKPILSVKGGIIEFFSKVRGNVNKCEIRMLEFVKSDLMSKFKAKEFSGFIVGITGVGLSIEKISNFKNLVLDILKCSEVFYNPAPFSVAAHTGRFSEGIGISKKMIT